jgi:hypothetical protein
MLCDAAHHVVVAANTGAVPGQMVDARWQKHREPTVLPALTVKR